MVGKTFGINELAAERNEAALKTFRLGNAAEGGDFFFFEQSQVVPFTGEHVLEIERVMHAFDDARVGIVLGDALPEGGGVSVAFGDENGAGAREVRGRLAQRAAREHALIAEGLLAVD